MRIFSKFHDYYDTSLKFGIDPTIIYERKEEDITEFISKQPKIEGLLNKIKKDIFDPSYHNFTSFNVFDWYYNYLRSLDILSKIVILFCGKVYFCYNILVTEKEKIYPFYPKTTQNIIYTFNDIIKYNKKEINNKDTNKIKSLFEKQGMKSDIAFKLHFELDSPIIMINSGARITTIIKNPNLKNIEFYRMIDPPTAFQELSMFIGGIMGGKSPAMIEVSDKDRIAKHGFDKYSFRKEKGE
jgi:hypothetical protein